MRRFVAAGAVLILAVGIALALWSSNDRAQVAGPAGKARFDRPLQFKALDASAPVRVMRGRVVGDSGPVAGAFILVTSDEGDAFSSAGCPEKPEASFFECHCGSVRDSLAWRFSEGDGEATPIASAVSKADGTFEVAGIPDGRFAVWADTSTGAAVALGIDATATVDLRIRPGRTFEGVTLMPDGGALANTLVGAVLRAHSRFFLAKSDARGRYRLGPLPEGDYELVASTPGFEPATQPARFGTTLALRDTRRVSGVVTLDGNPVPGVAVTARVFCSRASTRSDANGRFTLDRLRAEKTTLMVRSSSRGGHREIDLRTADLEGIEIALEEGGSIKGTVRSETDDPIGGAQVSVELRDPDFDAKAISDAEGSFELLGLPAGEYSMWLSPPPGSLEPGHRFVGVEKGRESTVSYVLGTAGRFTGMVLDERNRPIFRASINGHLATGTELRPNWEAHQAFEASSRFDGTFSLDHAPPGRLELSVTADGFLASHLTVDSPGTTDIRLTRGAELNVEVRTQAGSPAGQAHVTLTTPQGDAGEQARIEGLADASGRASFDGLAPGPYRVTAQLEQAAGARGPHYIRTIATDVLVALSAPAEAHLQFDEGVAIRGRVIDKKSGEGIAGAQLMAVDELVDPPPGIRTDVIHFEAGGGASTDARGHFTIEHLRPGPHRVTWFAKGYEFPEEQIIRPAGPEVTLVLARDGAVRGRILRPDGSPATEFSVERTKFQSPDGRFAWLFEEDGSRRLSIEATGFAPLLRTVKLAKGVDVDLGDLTLSVGRDVKVSVVSGAPPRPVSRVPVSIGILGERRWTLEHQVGEATTDSDGVALFKAIPRLPFHVLVAEVDIGASQVALDPDANAVTVTLGPTGTVEGVVLTQKGVPIRNLEVGAAAWSGHKSTKTDAAGRFTISGLPAETYSVGPEGEATSNFGLRERTVELGPGATTRVEFVETKGGQLTVVVGEGKCRWLMLTQAPAAGELNMGALDRLMASAAEPALGSEPAAFRGVPAGTYSLLCVTGDIDDTRMEAAVMRVELTGNDLTVSPEFKLLPIPRSTAPETAPK